MIKMKRAAGRTKDKSDVRVLMKIYEKRSRRVSKGRG
jgi:hypothetical protein